MDRLRKLLGLSSILLAGLGGQPRLCAQAPLLGMNIVNPAERGVAEQNATIQQLRNNRSASFASERRLTKTASASSSASIMPESKST